MDTGNNSNNSPEIVKTRKGIRGRLLFTVIIVIYSLILLFSGILIGNNGKKAVVTKLSQFTKLNNPDDPMFANLQGSFTGKIVKIEGNEQSSSANKAYVLSEKGGYGVFNINDPISVSEINGGKIVSLGSTQDKVRLNETATIKITGAGNGYTIYAITYFKDNPVDLKVPLNPLESSKAATPAAKPKANTKN